MNISELYDKYIACGYRVTTDSRAIAGGEIFFALRGETFDGNNYALGALEKGAAYAVVNEDAFGADADARLIRVADPFTTLRDLAAYHRLHVVPQSDAAARAAGLQPARLPVFGLTGTNGKTTTKELINAVLSAKYKVTATRGNLNNDIGVPLSLLTITPATEVAVIEMGANHPDDIAKLVRVSQPDMGLITNVGKAHLLGFGSFEGVKAAKSELYRWVAGLESKFAGTPSLVGLAVKRSAAGKILVNNDDSNLPSVAAAFDCEKFNYGLGVQGAEVLPTSAAEPFVRVRFSASDGYVESGYVIETQLVGAYNATNVMAALAVGRQFGVPFVDAAAAISAYCPTNNRSQLMRSGSNTLVVDAYNANPSSMSAALDNFAAFSGSRRLALLGDMRELGSDSVAEHVAIVRKVAALGLEAMFVGDEFRKALASSGLDFPWFADSEALASYLSQNLPVDTILLVKGSRGIQMEKVLKLF